MRIVKYVNRKINHFRNFLCCPKLWFDAPICCKLIIIMLIIVHLGVGIFINSKDRFTHFYLFSIIFYTIALISFFCIRHYSKSMQQIVNALAPQPAARGANGFYYAFLKRNSLYVIVPISVALIFGVGGCSMLTVHNKQPILVWILSLFFVVVYISIVGYVQYIFLFVYIVKLAQSKNAYTNITRNLEEYIPAELAWIQDLTKLYHLYRGAFFTLGSLYIVAFALFCFLPQMRTNISNHWFFILWNIIFLAIVVVFPITTFIEQLKIKEIVHTLKKTYVKTLQSDIKLKNKNETSVERSQRRFFETLYISQIMNSKDYPIKSLFNSVYSIALALLNIATSIITIIQGITTL